MASIVLRFLTLLALAFMPMGMATTPAAAHPPVGASGHCEERQKPVDAPATPKAHCAACAALPAVDLAVALSDLRPAAPRQVVAQQWVTERGPELATPPPKLS